MAHRDDSLPTFHRTLKLPARTWSAAKGRGRRDRKPVRQVVSEALDTELQPLIESLRHLGLDGDAAKAKKLVRLPIDDHVVGLLNHGRRRTGLPAVCLLALCLHRHASRSA